MMDPVGFTSEYAKNWSLPSHIVLYEPEEKLLREFLVSHSFRQVNSGTLPGVNSVHISTTRSFCLCSWVLTSYIYRKKGSSMLTSKWIVIFKHWFLSMF